MSLTKENLIRTLEKADYLYWARHVAKNNWYWYEEEPLDGERLFGRELPELGPILIHSPSCGSFHPWVEDNIALAFTDRGADTYMGRISTVRFPRATLSDI